MKDGFLFFSGQDPRFLCCESAPSRLAAVHFHSELPSAVVGLLTCPNRLGGRRNLTVSTSLTTVRELWIRPLFSKCGVLIELSPSALALWTIVF